MIEMVFMRGVEFFACYIIIRAGYEAYSSWVSSKEKGVMGSTLHANYHVAVSLGILAYNSFDLFSYVWFEHLISSTDFKIVDYTIFFFNLLFMNLLFLLILVHFKQEREKNITEIRKWKDLFKF